MLILSGVAQDELLRRTVFGYQLRWAEKKLEIKWKSTKGHLQNNLMSSYSGKELNVLLGYQSYSKLINYSNRPLIGEAQENAVQISSSRVLTT